MLEKTHIFTYAGDKTLKKKNQWDDHYSRRARDEKWLARSVYKLEEIDKRFKFIHPGDYILDLGCYPGSWSQYGLKKVGPRGEVAGIDIIEPVRVSAPNFRFIKADVNNLDIEWLKGEIGKRHAVISDLAPKTTGIHVADVSRSMELAERAMEIALGLLINKGRFLCKIFEGKDLKAFKDKCSVHFERIRIIKPPAVRKKSREIYLACLGLQKE